MFLESPSFPACPSRTFTYTVSPTLSVTISSAASGNEFRNRNWSQFVLSINCQCGPRNEPEIEALRDFWYAVGATECGFRFKEWGDYKSCNKTSTPTPFDQPTQLIPGSPGGYQLIKAYRAGERVQVRPILKPKTGTILIGDSGAPLSVKHEGTDYSIDYTTGLASVLFMPVGDVTWGGEFDVPVRFDSEFPIELVNFEIEQVQFSLKELRNPDGTS
jgi:uncharacterized protein (TIGR02217 family)